MKIEGRISTDPWMLRNTPHPKIKCLVILLESVGEDYVYIANQSVEIGGSYCFENLKDASYVVALEYETKEGVKEMCTHCGEREPRKGEDECDECFDAYADMRWREGAADAFGDDDD